MRRVLYLLVVLTFTASCSTETNINQFIIGAKSKKALDTLLAKAQLAYDKGEYADALDFAMDAQAASPGSEDVAVLLGYIYLALGGIDSFALASGLISAGKSSSSSLALSSSTSSTLDTLRSVIGITDDDTQKLGTLDQAGSDLPLFEGKDVIIPSSASEARAGDVAIIANANKAITAICPFVNSAARNSDDSRHAADVCVPTTNERFSSGKAHFLWAFAHLTEAIAFNNVVLYQESGNSKTNIELRVDAMSDSSVSVSSYVTHVQKLSENLTSILNYEDTNSQLRAMYNGLITTSLAFTQMPGVPSKVTKGIESAVSSIQEKQDSLSSSGTEGGTEALKGELTESVASELSSQISSLASSDPDSFAENKTEICSSYSSISPGATLPSECN